MSDTLTDLVGVFMTPARRRARGAAMKSSDVVDACGLGGSAPAMMIAGFCFFA